ncbi:MAG: type I methionyl aminopeptidase [Candidatus Cloacimonetes bacterium]|nr:type I methionyl aminopeptidase [Candidatus Cloacimonadota bacterium]
MIIYKTDEEIKKMREAGRLCAKLLDQVAKFIKIGISTEEINTLVNDFALIHNAIPATLNYNGFPKSVCTSINNVVCHGIPSPNEILKDGDIINVDVTLILNGYFGDSSRTFLVGNVSEQARLLVERTEKAMYKGIEAIGPGKMLFEVGKAIETYLKPFHYGIVREYGGHGVGRSFHEDPHVFHFFTMDNKIKLRKGMTFTVEPMINQGRSHKVITSRQDGWTVTTADKSLSAQFEHTVVVTDNGYEILTVD